MVTKMQACGGLQALAYGERQGVCSSARHLKALQTQQAGEKPTLSQGEPWRSGEWQSSLRIAQRLRLGHLRMPSAFMCTFRVAMLTFMDSAALCAQRTSSLRADLGRCRMLCKTPANHLHHFPLRACTAL